MEQAARVLRPGGRIALFWNAFQLPPQLAEAFAQVYAELLPEHPMYQHGVRAGKEVYAPLLAGTADRLHDAGFEQAEHWRDEWQRTYTRAEWLDLFPTFGGHALLPRKPWPRCRKRSAPRWTRSAGNSWSNTRP